MHPNPTATPSRLLAVTVCALLGWSAWARGGTVVSLQGPLPWIGIAILVCLALDRWGYGRQRSEVRKQESEIGCQTSGVGNQNRPPSTAHGPPWPGAVSERSRLTSALRPLTSDLLFWAGLAFLVLLTVQWWNAGRFPYFHPFEHRWVFTPPPHPGWPSAVERGEAAEMLRWFFPAWALMLALRHARQPAWLARCITWFLVINAGLLGAFGVAQMLSGTEKIFWTVPMRGHFFASFGYENHAASYFALQFALAAGVLLELLSRAGGRIAGRRRVSASTDAPPCRRAAARPHRRAPVVIASMCAVLTLAGMALSFSRTGLAMTLGLGGMALLAAARAFWRRVSLAQRVGAAAAVIMALATFFFLVASMGGVPLARAAAGLSQTRLDREMDCRLFMTHSALRVWADHPWFGVGGWGYRHYLPACAVEHGVRRLWAGYANAHNDTVQFLCEFGLVGFGLMACAVLACVIPLLRLAMRGFSSAPTLMLAGLLAVTLHSTIDLPFRSPAILYAWLAVCGASAVAFAPERAGDGSHTQTRTP